MCGESPIDVKKVTIGQYADYYSEWDGMVESGPGCLERLQARIDALPDGHRSKVQLLLPAPHDSSRCERRDCPECQRESNIEGK